MLRRYSAPLLLIGFSMLLLAMVFFSIGLAAPPEQEVPSSDENGQIYEVRPGDSLSRISSEFYNDATAYPRIVEATNAKAAVDEQFAMIQDPRRIWVGQRLWLPDLSMVAAQPAAQAVRFAEPLTGATVEPTFTVAMAADGLTVEPAGEIVEGAGHFHILVDTDFVPPEEIIPFDDGYLHFGGGQLTTMLALEPGIHTLRLQFANGAHQALDGPQFRDTISVTVVADATAMMTDTKDVVPSVRFVEPETGATVPPIFTVAMAADSLTVEPAGEIVEGAGHFHILVDTDFVPPEEIIPFDDGYLHFGGGQLTTTLALEPGIHTLRLQFANGAHQALDGPQFRDTVSVTVAADATAMITNTIDIIPSVRFVEPETGATVAPTFTVAMVADGLTVEPAGEIVEGAGHFHILVDTDFVLPEEIIPFDDGYLHFGGGQLTTTLALEPGLHTLRLQFANGAHQALDGPQFRDTISVTVAADVGPVPGSTNVEPESSLPPIAVRRDRRDRRPLPCPVQAQLRIARGGYRL